MITRGPSRAKTRQERQNPMRKAAILASVLALSACVYPNAHHVAELDALIGKPEADLIRTEGVPVRTYLAGGSKFLAYSRSRIESIPGGPAFGPYGGFGPYWGGWGGGWGGWGGFDSEIIQRDCETTFELTGGVVRHWSFRGNAC